MLLRAGVAAPYITIADLYRVCCRGQDKLSRRFRLLCGLATKAAAVA